jgi:hypothetical protein
VNPAFLQYLPFITNSFLKKTTTNQKQKQKQKQTKNKTHIQKKFLFKDRVKFFEDNPGPHLFFSQWYFAIGVAFTLIQVRCDGQRREEGRERRRGRDRRWEEAGRGTGGGRCKDGRKERDKRKENIPLMSIATKLRAFTTRKKWARWCINEIMTCKAKIIT